ncbi:MAG: flagellin lysine-N-methylase [Desulfobacterales bacterium]|nr:flagellin lysine-N-methylase [Desulfobacterales bacterium]
MKSKQASSKLKTTIAIVHPGYLQHFKCLGSACRDHCCYGWDIVVDKVTYKKLCRCPDTTVADLFSKHVHRNKSDCSEKNYARISKVNDHCAFLTTARLCLIQSRLGESFLPDVCAIFPRHFRPYGQRIEMSASVSCPEIARLAMQNPDSLDMVESQIDGKRLEKLRATTTAESFCFNGGKEAVTCFSIQLLKNRTFQLWERLLLLGFLCKEVSGLDGKGRSDDIIALIGAFADHVQTGFFNEILAKAPVMTSLQLQIVKRLTDEKSDSIRVKAFSTFVDDCFSGLQYDGANPNMQAIKRRYDLSYKKYFLPFAKNHQYLFENYLINFLFSSELGVSDGKGVYDQFVLMALHFAMIKTYLIGLAAFGQKPLSPDLTIDLIYSFTKTVEPDARFKSYALDLLENSGCGDVMSVAVLLKNE